MTWEERINALERTAGRIEQRRIAIWNAMQIGSYETYKAGRKAYESACRSYDRALERIYKAKSNQAWEQF